MSRRGPQIPIGSSVHAMYSQMPMMQGDLMSGPDDQGMGGLGGGGHGGGNNDFGSGDPHHQHHHQQQQHQQHTHQLLNRAAAVNRFMLSAPSTAHAHHHHHHHPSKMYQLSPTSSPPRQRGRKPQNVHPSMVIDQHSYVAMKPEPGVPFDMFSQNNMGHLVMQQQSSADMVVGQNMEVGGSDPSGQGAPHGEIILVPNNMLKQGMLEGGEVVVGGGGSIGNEIVIDNRPGRLPMGGLGGLGGGVGGGGGGAGGGIPGGGSSSVANSSSSEDNDYDDSALVIDTTAMQRGPAPGGSVGGGGGGNPSSGHPVGYDCAECGAVMKSRGSLKKHIAKYHAPAPEQEVDLENRVYACPACPYQTQRRDKLDKHVGKHLAEGLTLTGKRRGGGGGGGVGGGIGGLGGGSSGGGGGGKGNSNFPQRMRHAAEEYRCPFCPYKCTVEKALRKHNKLHQAGTKQFVVKVSCMICGKDRSTEADLRKHMKKHREGKDFHCDICGFASIQLKKIIQHRRMHTGEKPHLCPHCTYRSSRRDNLRSHVRRMHKKENMYIDTFNPRTDVTME